MNKESILTLVGGAVVGVGIGYVLSRLTSSGLVAPDDHVQVISNISVDLPQAYTLKPKLVFVGYEIPWGDMNANYETPHTLWAYVSEGNDPQSRPGRNGVGKILEPAFMIDLWRISKDEERPRRYSAELSRIDGLDATIRFNTNPATFWTSFWQGNVTDEDQNKAKLGYAFMYLQLNADSTISII